jgi:hypothetical protein
MRDLTTAEIGHVYGAGGKGRSSCNPDPCKGSRSKGSKSKGSCSRGSKSKGSRSKGRCY